VAKSKVTIWLEDTALKIVDEKAQANKVSRSAVVSEYLTRALKDGAEESGLELIVPSLKEALRKEVKGMSDRLAHLLVRAALEAATTRSLLYNEVVHRAGAEAAKATHKSAYTASVERLKKPSKGLLELLGGEDGGC